MTQLSAANPTNGKVRYDSLDGLRAYAAIGIILMHVLGNGAYQLDGFLFDRLIPSCTDLVYLFMVISGFSMCCGYYEKTVSGQLDLWQFYAKRFAKVWPFFAVLCLVDFIISPSMNALYEVLANLTLCFGLIPDADISVIGVGWFLGLVFVFYFMFPFFCSLLSDKKRAWFALAVALMLSLLVTARFGGERYHIAYSGVFFLAGGMLYRYREPLRRFADRYGWLLLAAAGISLVPYYLLPGSALVQLPGAVLITIYAMRTRRRKVTVLYNPVVKYLSGISMEIYLCHMLAYRILEKLHLVRLFPSELVSFIITAVATLVGSIVMTHVVNQMLTLLLRVGKKKEKPETGVS